MMKNMIKSRSEFNSVIFDNPVELLKAIKQHTLNYQEGQYDMCVVRNSLNTVFQPETIRE